LAKKFKFCIHCRRLILESEIARNEFVTTRYGLICRSCADRLGETPDAEPPPRKEEKTPTPAPAPRPAPPSAPPPSQPMFSSAGIEKLLAQLDQIQRILLFEKSSAWNVVGAVTQCLAVGMLLLAVLNWHDQPMNLLLTALLFQVMTLTFFVKAK
jgi:hypothetical protein